MAFSFFFVVLDHLELSVVVVTFSVFLAAEFSAPEKIETARQLYVLPLIVAASPAASSSFSPPPSPITPFFSCQLFQLSLLWLVSPLLQSLFFFPLPVSLFLVSSRPCSCSFALLALVQSAVVGWLLGWLIAWLIGALIGWLVDRKQTQRHLDSETE